MEVKAPLRILQLEDNPNDAELVLAALHSEGIIPQVTRVETRGDFLASLEQGGFDVILADYTLPSFDGLSALRIALEVCPDVPFIFVSGTLGEEVATEALKIGATDYLLKERLSNIGPSVQRALRAAKERDEGRAQASRGVAGWRETPSRNDRQRRVPLDDPRDLVPTCRGTIQRFFVLDSVVGSGWQSSVARRGAEPSQELYRRDRR
jgi:CheY-like chemotaxis protein